jgi:hypothetical protein
VESLAVAEVDGVGVRLLLDHRQGYVAGSLDPEVVAETVAEARQRRLRHPGRGARSA